MEYIFRVDMKVRSYECDMQGVVNNAAYLNYMEYARCEWLNSMGLNWDKMCIQREFLLVTNIRIKYKQPLRYDDNFSVCCNIRRESIVRLIGQQDIYKDRVLISEATVDVVGINSHGKYRLPQVLIEKLPEDSRPGS